MEIESAARTRGPRRRLRLVPATLAVALVSAALAVAFVPAAPALAAVPAGAVAPQSTPPASEPAPRATLPASAQRATPTGDAAAPAKADAIAGVVTVVVVRHAEKDAAGDPADPGLSDAGRPRAAKLAKLHAKSGASRFYASEFRRAKETLVPLAEAAHGTVTVVPAREAKRLVAELEGLPAGTVAVVAGHSNTVPGLVRALGGETRGVVDSKNGPMLDEGEYGRIFVVTRPAGAAGVAGAASTLELAYCD